MKKLLFLVAAAVAGVSVFADNWVYDPNGEIDYLGYKGGVVSDGVWKFKATVSGSTIKFGAVATNVYPEVVTPIDFSKPVEKAGDPSTTYTITELNDGFGFYRNGWTIPEWGYTEGGWDSVGYRPCCYRVGEITFPQDGLTAIGARFFTHCTNLTTVTEKLVLPASLTSIGRDSFLSCKKIEVDVGDLPSGLTAIGEAAFAGGFKVTGDLNLPNIKTISGKAFMGTGITSAKLGPNLASTDGNGESGPFAKCLSLTNVVFDANASTEFKDGGMFYGCTSLKRVDLAGVVKIGLMTDADYYSHFKASAVEEVFFSERLAYLAAYSLSGDSALAEVHFYGMPPATLCTPVFGGVGDTQTVTTYVHLDKEAKTYDYNAAKAAWDKLTAGGELLEDGSTWSEDMAGKAYKVRDLVLYVPSQGGEELGYWVYDDRVTPSVVSNGVWCFKATKSGKSITVLDVITYPSQPTELDFSKSLTDLNKTALTFSSISPHFGIASGGDRFKGGLGSESVSKLMLPTNGLFTIGEYAFCGCANLTEITPCVPDSVTTVGYAAFQNVQLAEGKGDVRLYGISTLEEHVFLGASVTSVTFGPDLRTVRCHWHEGAFYGCSQLTNVVFDAAMQGATMTGWTEGPFTDCSKITCPLDMSGFADLTFHFISGTKVPEVIVGAGCRNVVADFFSGDTSLTNVICKCRLPDILGEPVFSGVGANQKVTTQILWENRDVTNSSGKCWLDYAAGGFIDRKHSTWAAARLVDGVPPKNRPLIAPDAKLGLMMIVK